jgi:hypothetical protein
MYGKHFESMYEGSMYGAGVVVFAVWGYVIAFTHKSRVELNPRKLADTLGGKVEEIEEAIKKLQEKDPESRNKEYEGRRLVKEGEYQYYVPSWESYQNLKNEDARREQNRLAQMRWREKQRKWSKVIPKTAQQKRFEETGEMPNETFKAVYPPSVIAANSTPPVPVDGDGKAPV